MLRNRLVRSAGGGEGINWGAPSLFTIPYTIGNCRNVSTGASGPVIDLSSNNIRAYASRSGSILNLRGQRLIGRDELIIEPGATYNHQWARILFSFQAFGVGHASGTQMRVMGYTDDDGLVGEQEIEAVSGTNGSGSTPAVVTAGAGTFTIPAGVRSIALEWRGNYSTSLTGIASAQAQVVSYPWIVQHT